MFPFTLLCRDIDTSDKPPRESRKTFSRYSGFSNFRQFFADLHNPTRKRFHSDVPLRGSVFTQIRLVRDLGSSAADNAAVLAPPHLTHPRCVGLSVAAGVEVCGTWKQVVTRRVAAACVSCADRCTWPAASFTNWGRRDRRPIRLCKNANLGGQQAHE